GLPLGLMSNLCQIRFEFSKGMAVSHHKSRPPFRLAPGHGVVRRPVETAPGAALAESPPSPGAGGQTIQHQTYANAGDLANQFMVNLGGAVLSSVQIRLVFWGREWAAAPPVPLNQVIADVKAIVAGPYLEGVKQYGVV